MSHITCLTELLCIDLLGVQVFNVVPAVSQFPLSSIVLCATHQENKRLFGFVLQTAGGRVDGRPVTVCYVLESNNDGEKVQNFEVLHDCINC